MKLSVVIPVYNAKGSLRECVDSVLRQSYDDIEVILVDDGSTDGSSELCDQLAAANAKVRVVHQPNSGVATARNRGTECATGQYITYMDADDYWLTSDGIATLMDDIENETDAMLFKSVDIWGERHVPTADYDIAAILRLPTNYDIFDHLISRQQLRMSAWTVMVRRQLLVDNNILFPTSIYSEDIDWVLQLWQYVQQVRVANVELYGYVHQLSSRSTTASMRVYESHEQIITRWAERCDAGCANAAAIRSYLANLWVNRGYFYHQLPEADKPAALQMLQRTRFILQYATSKKAVMVRRLVGMIGLRGTVMLLGTYWRLRMKLQRNAI